MVRRWLNRPKEIIAILTLVVITTLIFGSVVWQMIYNVPLSDYAEHIRFAHDILELHQFAAAHILYQTLIIGLSVLPSLSLEVAGWIVAVVFYVLTILILYTLVRRVISANDWRSVWLSAGTALVLLLVTPISLLTLPAHNLYYGYIGINVLHNPTTTLLKPFALLLFVFTIAILDKNIRLSSRTVVIGVLLIFLSVFAKPNFVLVLLPALVILIGYRMVRRQPVDFKTLVTMLIVPMIVVLALDYVAQFLLVDQGADGSGIMFAPLLSIYIFDRNIVLLPIKFLLSILFPLVVSLTYRRLDSALKLAWLVFIIGAAQMYLFAESGTRMRDGNFWWSAQIGLFVLFVFSALFWLRHFRDQPRWRGWLCLAILALHLISGVIFYVLQFHSGAMMDWW